MPRRISHGTHDFSSGEDTLAEISTTGAATALIDDIEIVQPKQMLSQAEQWKFMNELVEIQIEEDPDEHAPLFVHSAHNGDVQYIIRGQPTKVKRRFLYVLLAAKSRQFSCSFGKGENGLEFNRMPGRPKKTHNLNVIYDPNPGGRKWMQEVMMEGSGSI